LFKPVSNSSSPIFASEVARIIDVSHHTWPLEFTAFEAVILFLEIKIIRVTRNYVIR
jgi:hypothetical protein